MPHRKTTTADVATALGLLATLQKGGTVYKGWVEIAAFLRVSRSQAIRYRTERGLPVGYIGRTPQITTYAISEWLTRQKKGKKTPYYT